MCAESQIEQKTRVRDVRLKAMDLLARREQSQWELTDKLTQRFPDDVNLVASVVATLAEEGLQSDPRYCESFLRTRLSRGQGPQRMLAELTQRGIDRALADATLSALGVDWVASAVAARHKRFGNQAPKDQRERGRQMRFLQQRGFSFEQIHAALAGTDEY